MAFFFFLPVGLTVLVLNSIGGQLLSRLTLRKTVVGLLFVTGFAVVLILFHIVLFTTFNFFTCKADKKVPEPPYKNGTVFFFPYEASIFEGKQF